MSDKSRRARAPDPVAVSPPAAGTDRDPALGAQDAAGTAALLAQLEVADGPRVDGPMGRVYQRILNVGTVGPNEAAAGFDRRQLHRYLDTTLELADDEWFRDRKLDGVADALMTRLDANHDGRVSWAEFEAFEAQTLQALAPGVDAGSTDDQVRAAAGNRFREMDDDDRDGRLTLDELQEGTEEALPDDTDHADLARDDVRPYFLWWADATTGDLRRHLDDPDDEVRAYWLGALLREDNTRDVWLFTTPDAIRRDWPHLVRFLGRSRPMWAFLLQVEDPGWPPAHARA